MLNNSNLSRYVYTFAYNDNQTILYNSLNRSVILLDNEKLNNNFKNLSGDEINQLKEMDFLNDNNNPLRKITEIYDNCNSDVLNLIIELTQKCNLQCTYCYQEDWSKSDKISLDTIEKILVYTRNCLESKNYTKLSVNFIGGEPLVESELLILIYDKLKLLCDELAIKFQIDIDTNGVLLTREFLSKLDNVNLSVSLTLPDDHDIKRVTKSGQSTYDTIVSNLILCKDIFESKDKNCKLFIRYNVDYYNKSKFPEFLDHLLATGLKFYAYTAYTFEHECNPYKNTWSLNDYKIWNSSEGIDILIDKGFHITHSPNVGVIPCKAYYKHSLKIYADGYLGLCNGHSPTLKKFKIDDVYNDIDNVIEFFPEKKQKPFANSTCSNCKELALCGGARFCKDKFCEYGDLNLETYLKTYVKHMLIGNSNYFLFNK